MSEKKSRAGPLDRPWSASEAAREKRRAAAASVAAGLLLTGLKAAAAFFTDSLGLLAEAAHSAFDLGAALLTWFAVRAAERPPDADHPYGHGRIENLAALAEAVLLVLTALWVIYEALARLMGEAPHVEASPWAFAVLGISIAVDIVRSRDLTRVARRTGSQALEADALHFQTDIATVAVVILGLFGVALARAWEVPALAHADSIAAIAVALVVLALAWRLGRRAADVLADRVPPRLLERIETALRDLPGLRSPPRVRAREAGNKLLVDVELALAPGVPLAEGDRIAAEARRRVREAAGRDAETVVELRALAPETSDLHDRIALAVAMEGEQAHNLTVRRSGEGTQADLHLELPAELDLEAAHAVADRVEKRIREEVPELGRVDIHLEHRSGTAESARPLTLERFHELSARACAAAAELAGEGALHDLHFQETPSGLYLSAHLFVDPSAKLEAAHALSEEVEARLREAIPELNRVALHVEPWGHHR